MLPLALVRAATGSAVLVELKTGDTYNGRLVSADPYMNVFLENVICTAAAGDRFWKLEHAHIRGSAIQYLRLPDAALDTAVETEKEQQNSRGSGGRGRGRRGRFDSSNSGRGRGRGRGGGGGRGERGGGRGRGGRGYGRGRTTGGRSAPASSSS